MMADDSVKTVCGIFATREEAERAVEHLVQEHGIDRSDVFVRAQGSENSAGTGVSGGDAAEGNAQESAEEAALEGLIEVSADVRSSQIADAEGALREVGAQNVSTR